MQYPLFSDELNNPIEQTPKWLETPVIFDFLESPFFSSLCTLEREEATEQQSSSVYCGSVNHSSSVVEDVLNTLVDASKANGNEHISVGTSDTFPDMSVTVSSVALCPSLGSGCSPSIAVSPSASHDQVAPCSVRTDKGRARAAREDVKSQTTALDYFERRRRNNQSASQSRLRKKEKQMLVAAENRRLEKDNLKLSARVEALELELRNLKALFGIPI